MDELIKHMVDKLGISQDVARKAVLIVVDYLKTKLPEPLASTVDGVIEVGDVDEEESKLLGQFRIP